MSCSCKKKQNMENNSLAGKITEIYTGYKNLVFKKEDIEEMFKRRYEICKVCEDASMNKKDYHTLRTDEHCTICHCPLASKLRSPSTKCPIDKWGPENV